MPAVRRRWPGGASRSCMKGGGTDGLECGADGAGCQRCFLVSWLLLSDMQQLRHMHVESVVEDLPYNIRALQVAGMPPSITGTAQGGLGAHSLWLRPVGFCRCCRSC